jgi:hypothetical protein
MDDALAQLRKFRRDAENPDRDRLAGIDMLRGWLRGLHINIVIGHDAAQDMTQDEIAAQLGEHPRGHERFAKVDPAWRPPSLSNPHRDPGARWGQGVPHDPRSLKLFKSVAEIDFKMCSDYFGWKWGGDGDNGETFMYELDEHFQRLDEQVFGS